MHEDEPVNTNPYTRQQIQQQTDQNQVNFQTTQNVQQNSTTQSNYQDLVVKIQKNIRANLIRVKLKEQFKKIHKRRKILKELIDTEEGYIRDLGFIVSDFKMRMKSRGILTLEQCQKLFANVDQIRKLHDIFFSTIYNHFASYHPYLIIFADVLGNILFFRIYIEYLNNFPMACDLIDQYKKTKPAFASFVAQIARIPQYRFLSLQDYMIKPVQRLPKYVLLLKQLLKNTQQSHPDYQNVKKALERFEEVNNNNNEKLNKIRNSYKLRELESMLQLPDGVITPSTDFLLEETVQVMSQQTNEVISNCVIYLLNSTIIATRRYGNILNRQTQAASHSARISQAGFGASTMKQKLQALVPIKYGTSIKLNKDQCFYKNSFTVQSPEGESCTFICANQEELHNLYNKISKQIDTVKEQTMGKLKSMFQSETINHNSTFIKAISLLDLVPEVTVLGTSERTDKMLKYTVYIVEVKIKMIRQKIFLRFSQLLELERYIATQYGNKFVIKQGLVSSSWLNNHHQKTIQQRKMNIQRFLKQILSKPQVIESGWKILLRLGLPGDFYELPSKIVENKTTQSFIKKSTILGKSTLKRKNFKSNKMSTRFRLSLFQQQKIEEMEQQNLEDEDMQVKLFVKQSFQHDEHINPKSSYGSSYTQRALCIQDILKANEINLGHYTRQESIDMNQTSFSRMDRFENMLVSLQILVPCLQSLYSIHKHPNNPKTENKYEGFRTITIKCTKVQRVQHVIPMIAKQISLRYYKDYRLLIQKEYSQRVLDDDELVHKIIGEINRTRSTIIFRKIIYIDHEIQEKELIRDKERLEILAGQIINEIKLGKYRLNYENYLKFAVLSAIVYKQSLMSKKIITTEMLHNFAKESKASIFPKYSSLSQTEDIWVADFVKAYNIIEVKLKEVAWLNYSQVQKQKEDNGVEFHESEHESNNSYWANTNIKYLALLSIVKEIEKKQHFYGCVEFPVQISQEFKRYLEQQSNADIENSIAQCQVSIEPGSQTNGTQISSKISTDTAKSRRKLSDQQNKNCWLGIKHNKVIFTSITKGNILLELDYENLVKIQPYASAVVLEVKNMQVHKIKLKTTSSYYIREMLVYYKNYRTILKKICLDSDLRESIIGISREELGVSQHQEMDEIYL